MNRTTIGLLIYLIQFGPAAQADELGRLFFTPAQRAQLEQRRYQPSTSTTHADSEEHTDESTDDRILTVNGIVQKTGGKRTVWINGSAQKMGYDNGSSPESIIVTLPDQTKAVKLKVGQRIKLAPPANPPATKPPASTPEPADND